MFAVYTERPRNKRGLHELCRFKKEKLQSRARNLGEIHQAGFHSLSPPSSVSISPLFSGRYLQVTPYYRDDPNDINFSLTSEFASSPFAKLPRFLPTSPCTISQGYLYELAYVPDSLTYRLGSYIALNQVSDSSLLLRFRRTDLRSRQSSLGRLGGV
jgi:hypothetical protein